jgi:hypothetical protein
VHHTRIRNVCCLWYAASPDRRACFTCPLTSDDERRRRLAGEGAE